MAYAPKSNHKIYFIWATPRLKEHLKATGLGTFEEAFIKYLEIPESCPSIWPEEIYIKSIFLKNDCQICSLKKAIPTVFVFSGFQTFYLKHLLSLLENVPFIVLTFKLSK